MSDYRHNLPDFRLSVGPLDLSAPDYTDITEKVRPRLVSLTLTEKRGGEADLLDIVLDDSDGKLTIPPRGAPIRLQLGWRQGSDVLMGLVDKGRYTVDETEWAGPPDQLTIRARSADLTDRFRARREKSWTETTLGAVARDIAAANGYRARIAPELARIPVQVLAQHEQSDMALLRELGRRHDAVATIKDRTLILSPIGKGATPTGRALPDATITRTEGDRYRFRRLDRGAAAGVEAVYHDTDTGERETVRAGGAEGEPRRLRRVFHDRAEAEAAATAAASRNRRAEAEFDMTLALGRPDLYPERPITLAGFKPEADALRWILAEIEHRYDSGGLMSRIRLEAAS